MSARVWLFTLSLVLTSSAVQAQSELPLRRLHLGAGVGFLGGASLGAADANLRSVTPNTPYRMFSTSTRVASATSLDLRAGFELTRRFGFEARALYGHPELRTEVTGDVENAPSVTAVERLDSYLIDGGIVVSFDEFRVKGWQPFAAAGGGHLRQLHEGLTVTEDGRLFYAGGGVRRMLVQRTRGIVRGLGARGDVRVNFLSGGITIDDERRQQTSVSGGVFFVF